MHEPPTREGKPWGNRCGCACLVALLAPFLYIWLIMALSLKPIPFSISWGSLRPAPVIAKSADELPRTEVVGTLDAPLAPGKNIIWCAAYEMAWQELRDQALNGEPVKLEGDPELARQLNASHFEKTWLPDGGYWAVGGDGAKVTKVLGQRSEAFRDLPGFDTTLEPGDLASWAGLTAQVPFDPPYNDWGKKFKFTDSQGATRRVGAFGLRPKDTSGFFDIREQAQFLFMEGRGESWALDLNTRSQPSQIVVAKILPGRTLRATLEECNRRSTPEAQREFSDEVLGVPEFHFRIEKRFKELEGRALLNEAGRGLPLVESGEVLQFDLDRTGAKLRVSARHAFKSESLPFVLDGPFLLYMKVRGAPEPYFVMWVDNAELMRKR